jgi:hypothetical protein
MSKMNAKVYTIPNFKMDISEEIRDLTANNIGQKLGTLGRNWEHWADIWDIGQILRTLSRYMGH